MLIGKIHIKTVIVTIIRLNLLFEVIKKNESLCGIPSAFIYYFKCNAGLFILITYS